MSTNTSKLTRRPPLQSKPIATHRFPLGAYVLYKVNGGSEKMSFRITRLLPDGGEGLQYRIKGERDGQERVVTESSLESGWGG